MDDRLDIPTRLTEASIEHEGRRFIRASVAAKIIGISPGVQTRWIKDGHITPLRLQVPRGPRAPRGILTAWPLQETIARALAYRPIWTDAELDLIRDLAGTARLGTIAQKLGRTVPAVRDKMYQLGLTQRSAQGLMTTGEIARLCGVSREAVQWWCFKAEPPLRFRRLPNRVREKMIDPADLREFFGTHPRKFARRSKAAQQRIERLTMPLHERRKAVAA